jgi:hypothetical protein
MPVFNYPDYHINSIRNAVCSNPIATSVAASRCNAINAAARMSQNDRISDISSCFEMDVDSMRNTLESMTPNAVFGDLAVLRDRQFIPRSRERTEELLRKLEDDYRKWEVIRINKLIRSKATIRYRIEVKVSNEI